MTRNIKCIAYGFIVHVIHYVWKESRRSGENKEKLYFDSPHKSRRDDEMNDTM